jgi:hypothetical protein
MMLFGLIGFGSVVACGGGGGEVTPNSVPPSSGTYQKPPSTYEPVTPTPPPNDYQKPPNSYQSGGGSGSELCDSVCGLVTSLSCATDNGPVPDLAACRSSCTQEIGSMPCVAQFSDLFDCVFNQVELTCQLLDKLQNGDIGDMDIDPMAIQACQRAADAYSACSGDKGPGDGPGNGPGNGNGNGNCDPAGDCSGCLNTCAACGCVYSDAPEMCASLCQ